MPAPVITVPTSAAIVVASLAANTTEAIFHEIDLSSKYEGQIVFSATLAQTAAVTGLVVWLYDNWGNPIGPTSTAKDSFSIPFLASQVVSQTHQSPTIVLPTGIYWCQFQNLDTSNAATNLQAWVTTVDNIT